jgi:ketosteroid isomerase-like protein
VTEGNGEQLVREYLKALEAGATGSALARFFARDVVQEEFPNRLMPQGARRDLAAILDGAERGQKVMQGQTYSIHSVISAGPYVVAEVSWVGVLAIPLGELGPGDRMTARFCVVVEIEDGKIRFQRNYDCFDPF